MNIFGTILVISLVLSNNVLIVETKGVQRLQGGKIVREKQRFAPLLKILEKIYTRDGSEEDCPEGEVYSSTLAQCVLDLNSNTFSDGYGTGGLPPGK